MAVKKPVKQSKTEALKEMLKKREEMKKGNGKLAPFKKKGK